MMLFTGQTANNGHFLQPTAMAMGQSVMVGPGSRKGRASLFCAYQAGREWQEWFDRDGEATLRRQTSLDPKGLRAWLLTGQKFMVCSVAPSMSLQ